MGIGFIKDLCQRQVFVTPAIGYGKILKGDYKYS
jgi:hypothetical protein